MSGYCQHTLDRIGLGYNCPSKYTVGAGTPDGTFEVCDSDLMDVPGVYVENGQTLSYAQPPESAGPITSIPYQPSVVASRNCVTTASSALFTQLVAATNAASQTSSGSGAAPTSGSPSNTASGPSGSPSRTGSSGAAGPTGNAQNQEGSSASVTRISAFATVFGVVAAVAFLA